MCRYDHVMYIMKYVCIFKIYIYISSEHKITEYTYIYKILHSTLKNIYIYKVLTISFPLDVIYLLCVSHIICSLITYM